MHRAVRLGLGPGLRSRSLQRSVGPSCSGLLCPGTPQRSGSLAWARLRLRSPQSRWAGVASLHTSSPRNLRQTSPRRAEETKTERMLRLMEEELHHAAETEKSGRQDIKLVEKKKAEVAKNPPSFLRAWIWEPTKHMVVSFYLGSKLLAIDVYYASGLLFRLMRGKTLTRREWKQLTVTVADIFRFVPFSIFLIVPFFEFFLPVYLKLFPGMLPTTFKGFVDGDKQKEKIVRRLREKTAFAAFLQSVNEELAIERSKGKGDDQKASMALEFANFMKKVRSEGGYVSNKELLRFTKLFENELTLDNLAMPQLRALCGVVGIPPLGTPAVLRFQLRYKLRSILADDKSIVQDGGVEKLTVGELQQANRDRGMRALGISRERLELQLRQWLELSLEEKVPPSLLLLSRTLYLPADVSFTDRLKSLMSGLPESVAEETRVKIAELQTGKVDTATRIKVLQRVQAALKEERAARRKEEAEERKRKDEEAARPPEPDSTGKILSEMSAGAVKDTVLEVDSQPIFSEDKPEFRKMAEDAETIQRATEASMMSGLGKAGQAGRREAESQAELAREDLMEIEAALHSAAGKYHEVREDLAELKEQVEEYQDGVSQAAMIIKEQLGEKAASSKAASLLSRRVEKLISNADGLLEKLHEERADLQENMAYADGSAWDPVASYVYKALTPPKPQVVTALKARLVDTNDLMLSLHRLKRLEGSTKMQQVQRFLQALETETGSTGKIDLDRAIEVVEMLGRENVKISPQQMAKIASLLAKEEKVEEKEDLSALRDPVASYIYGRPRPRPRKTEGDL